MLPALFPALLATLPTGPGAALAVATVALAYVITQRELDASLIDCSRPTSPPSSRPGARAASPMCCWPIPAMLPTCTSRSPRTRAVASGAGRSALKGVLAAYGDQPLPTQVVPGCKTVEVSDLGCPGLKLSIARAGRKTS